MKCERIKIHNPTKNDIQKAKKITHTENFKHRLENVFFFIFFYVI